jgi:hypothetical protein
MAITKREGDAWSANIEFTHEGPAKEVRVSGYIRFPGGTLAGASQYPQIKTANDASLKKYTAQLNGVINNVHAGMLSDGAVGDLHVHLEDLNYDSVVWPLVINEAYMFRKDSGLPDKFADLKNQLGIAWDYIAGGGYAGSDDVIWCYRGDEYLFASTKANINEFGVFQAGDIPWLWLSQSMNVTLRGKSQALFAGWNQFVWSNYRQEVKHANQQS